MKEKINKEELIFVLSQIKTIWECSEYFNCCINTIRNYMSKYHIKTPIGFFSKGVPLGRKKGFEHTKKFKKLLSKKFKGKNNPFYGKKHTQKTKKQMSKNHADFRGDKNPFKNSLKDIKKKIAHIERSKNNWIIRRKRNKFSYKKMLNDIIPSYYYKTLYNNAKIRNFEFKLNPSFLKELFLKQNKKCFLTGLNISFNDFSASLDRINSDLGYIKTNVRWVHKDINFIKCNYDDSYFIYLCLKVSENYLTN